MSGGTVTRSSPGSVRGPVTTPVSRMAALARAELTLLGRSKATIIAAVLVPLGLPFSLRPVVDDMNVEDSGLSVGLVLLPAAIGFSLLFGVYSALTGIYTARREELVLKRLRTGELRDAEVVAGSALPVFAMGLVQCVVLAVGCTAFLDVPAPEAPHLAVLVNFDALGALREPKRLRDTIQQFRDAAGFRHTPAQSLACVEQRRIDNVFLLAALRNADFDLAVGARAEGLF